MSEYKKEMVKCPRCHYDSPMTVWNSINVDLNPELKDKLLDGELYHWQCEVCGLENEVCYSTVYHDMKRQFMLIYSPWEDDDNKYESVAIPISTGRRADAYIYRTVFGVNHLREKILIFEHGLNDVAVVRMKYFIRLNSDNNVLPDDELFFFDVDQDSEKTKSSGFDRGAIEFIRLRKGCDPYLLAFPMELYYDYLLAVKVDPRMEVKEIACIDEGWIDLNLKKS